ncbi:MAG: hypothetical protein JSS02_19530 [Planctomycetes bacterium]|nr:hypothetical protein [Planctomycetota bacterium]
MSKRSYLVGSNSESIYPSLDEPSYHAPDQLLATHIDFVPLLWLALFREADLNSRVYQTAGDSVHYYAPVCAKTKALEHLAVAVPNLARLFAQPAGLADYVNLLRSAIEMLPYRFISIELNEIARCYPREHRFEDLLISALRGFDVPQQKVDFQCPLVTIELPRSGTDVVSRAGPNRHIYKELREMMSSGVAQGGKLTIAGFSLNSHADVLGRLSGIRFGGRLPAARMYLDDLSFSDEDRWNFTSLLGTGRHASKGYGREVPWEKEGANFGGDYDPNATDPEES